ncbi:MAG: hypothetical protein GY810_05045 [Aureispira sp.]|nr:hypothetical protein [Aureispira sp.]
MAGVFGPNHSCSKNSKKAFSSFIKTYDLDQNNESKKIKLPKKILNWNNSNKLDNDLVDDQLIGLQRKAKERRYSYSEPEVPIGVSALIGLVIGGGITFMLVKFFFIHYLGHSLY